MSRNQTHASPGAPDESDIADYLREHPAFFERHAELLMRLKLVHPSGRAVSLIERQVAALRSENKKLERKLLNLVQVARENERLGSRIQRLGVAVLESDSLPELLTAAEESLMREFGAERVVLRLIEVRRGALEALHGRYRVTPESEFVRVFEAAMRSRRVLCGRLVTRQLEHLFDAAAAATASAAVVPLYGGRDFGLLALGSSDPNRFQPAMGVLFLEQIGELLSAALKNHLG